VQTTSGVPASTEESVPEDVLSDSSSTTDGTNADPGQATIQLQPASLRRIAPKPVFVDASGRNRRRLRILVGALVTPIVAYVALLISTLVGGPTIPSALLPHPAAPVQAHPTPTHARPHPDKPQPSHVAVGPAATPVDFGHKVPKAKPSPSATATSTKGPPKTKSKPTVSPSSTITPHPKPSNSHAPQLALGTR
jgi:hypothetical protein